MYSCYSFLTSALDWSEWSASRPGRALPPGKGSREAGDRDLETRGGRGRLGIGTWRHGAGGGGWGSGLGEAGWEGEAGDRDFKTHLCRGSILDRPFVRPIARHYSD
jgi:hypothetical protein